MIQPSRFVISLDLELHWGVFDKRPAESYANNLAGVWAAVPRLLELFSRFQIGATWATVGILFAKDRDELEEFRPKIDPTFHNPELSPYGLFSSLGADHNEDPFHFGLPLVEMVADTPRQEIATHTFGHYYSLEPGGSLGALEADLTAATALARMRGIELTSIVFPRNQYNASILHQVRETTGIRAFRGNPRFWPYRPAASQSQSLLKRAMRLGDAYVPLAWQRPETRLDESGLIDVPATRFLRPWSARFRHLEEARLQRILWEMDLTAAQGGLYHLWWHPHNFGANQDQNFAFIEQVLERFAMLRERGLMISRTMAKESAEKESANDEVTDG